MSPAINQAILHAHLSGNLHAAALMTGQSASEHAVELVRQNPSLQVGWHLHLNDSQPTTMDAWPWGRSAARAGWSIGLSAQARELVRVEIKQQWNLFQATGLKCAFINSHHHLHAHPFVYRALLEIVGTDFTGWIRLGRPCAFDRGWRTALAFSIGDFFFARRRQTGRWPSPDTLWGVDRTFAMRADEIRNVARTLPDGVHEFVFHPRTLDCADTRCLIELKTTPAS